MPKITASNTSVCSITSNKLLLGTAYVSVPVETTSEESPLNGLDEIQPFLLGNSSSTSGTINLPVIPSKRRKDPTVPVGWNETLLPAGQPEPDSYQQYPGDAERIACIQIEHSPTISTLLRVSPGSMSAYPNCGMVRSMIVCPQDPGHMKRKVKCSCHRPDCPECWPSWAGRASERGSKTIEGYRKATQTKYEPRHIDISPHPDAIPFDNATPEALKWLLGTAKDILPILGIKAVAAIPHPYRLRKEVRDYVDVEAKVAGKNRYEWVLSQSNWNDYLKFSPHVHLLEYGYLLKPEDFQDKTGWQYHNHDGKSKDEDFLPGRTGIELGATLYYLLSHAWVRGNKSVIRYWFGMSTRRLGCEVTKFKEAVFCPKCGTTAKKIPPDLQIPDSNIPGGTKLVSIYQDIKNAPDAVRTVEERIYFSRKPRKRIRKKTKSFFLTPGVVTI